MGRGRRGRGISQLVDAPRCEGVRHLMQQVGGLRVPEGEASALLQCAVRCDRSACLSGCSFRTVSPAATAGGVLPCPALPSGQSPPPTHVASGLALPAELGT